MKEKLKEYIFENFTLNGTSQRLVSDIIDWIWIQSMDKEDTVSALACMLDSIGIEKDEIAHFVDFD